MANVELIGDVDINGFEYEGKVSMFVLGPEESKSIRTRRRSSGSEKAILVIGGGTCLLEYEDRFLAIERNTRIALNADITYTVTNRCTLLFQALIVLCD